MDMFFYAVGTTGLNPYKNSMIRLSGILTRKDAILEMVEIDFQPHPKAKIDAEALRYQGLTEDQIQKYQPLEQGVIQLVKIFRRYVDMYDPEDVIMPVGFNNRAFDDVFLSRTFMLADRRDLPNYLYPASIDLSCLEALQVLTGIIPVIRPSLKNSLRDVGIPFKEENLCQPMYKAQMIKKLWDTSYKINCDPTIRMLL